MKATPLPSALLEKRLSTLASLWRGRPGPLSRAEVERAGKALLSLQRGLTGTRRLAGAAYMDAPELLGAYLLYYWPVSYLQVGLAASSLPSLLPGLSSRARAEGRSLRLLDLGAGPGPAAAALLDALAPEPVELYLRDGSGLALELARSILGSGEARPAGLEAKVLDLETAAPAGGPFDLIVLSHALNELWRGSDDRIGRRAGLVEALAARLAPGGALLLLEPALLETSRDLLALRDLLAGRGLSVLSPCLASAPCPALAAGPGHTCHAEVAWDPPELVASLARAAGLDRESVKMSFFLLSADGRPQAEAPAPEGCFRARVVSEAMLNKAGRLRYLLCDGRRRFPLSARKDDEAARRQGFFSLRRYDLLEVEGAEARGPAGQPGPAGQGPSYGVGPASRLGVSARLDLASRRGRG